MPDPKDYDMNYRPESYWNCPQEGYTNIKGEMRRQTLDGAVESNALELLPGFLFSDELSEEERAYMASMHPIFMGGEYLPGYKPGEVEIARSSLESVTWDVISIRARQLESGKIAYRVVDEYDTSFNCSPSESSKPLTLGELISLIDSVEGHYAGGGPATGLTDCYRDSNYEADESLQHLNILVHFVHVTSLYYPELERWYDDEALEWYQKRLLELDTDSMRLEYPPKKSKATLTAEKIKAKWSEQTSGSYIFTSESVSEGHPDKVADQISDAVLDAYLEVDPQSKVACETLISHGSVILAGEVSSAHHLSDDYLKGIVRDVIREIGYVNNRLGFSCDRFEFQNRMHPQALDILHCVEKQDGCLGAGDQGLMFGYATDETPELMPLPIIYAHRLMQRHAEVRKSGELPWLGPDAKSQLSVRYVDGYPETVEAVVLSTQHIDGISRVAVEKAVIEHIIEPVIQPELRSDEIVYLVNPSGRFVTGGPEADTGLTGRKIIVDTYGGSCPHGGGAFSGKDPTKVDRSAAYMARYIAKNLVGTGLTKQCTVQISYAIGWPEPISFLIDFHGTGHVDEEEAVKAVAEMLDLSPAGIISHLDLRRPIYRTTAAYGHFGRHLKDFTWESPDLLDALRARLLGE